MSTIKNNIVLFMTRFDDFLDLRIGLTEPRNDLQKKIGEIEYKFK